MLFFLFLALYARTTRYEEAFFSLETKEKSLGSLARPINIYFVNNTWYILIVDVPVYKTRDYDVSLNISRVVEYTKCRIGTTI